MRTRILKLGLAGLSAVSFQQYRFAVYAEERRLGEPPPVRREADVLKVAAEGVKADGGGGRSTECIVVVGTTGTGKSSTIAKYTGQQLVVSDQASSVTRSCTAVQDSRGPQYPVWIDTIGYDDTHYLSDEESFRELLKFMSEERLLKVRAVVWTVTSQERKDARLRRQAEFINQFKDVEIWDNVVIVVKQPGSYNLPKASQGAHEAAKYFAGEFSKLQILGFTYLDRRIPSETLEKLKSLTREEREERLLVTDAELVEKLDSALQRIEQPVQVIFKDSQCTACGVIGDKRLLPDYCHLEQGFVHTGSLRYFHPDQLEGYHPLSLESNHPGVLKLTGGPSRNCESLRNAVGVVAPIVSLVDITAGLATAAVAGGTHYLCGKLNTPYLEVHSCCGGERFTPGCQVQYACCKRKEISTGCCFRFPCCLGGAEAPGCRRRYSCCSRGEEATGCQSICKKCGQAWGSPAGQCFRSNHQLIRYSPEAGS